VEGVDFDPLAVKNARSKILVVKQEIFFHKNIPIVLLMPFLLVHVIEHVPDPTAFLLECNRILKNRWAVDHRDANANAWGHAAFGKYWLPLDPPDTCHLFTIDAFKRVAEAVVLAILRMNTSAHGAAGIFRVVKKSVQKASLPCKGRPRWARV